LDATKRISSIRNAYQHFLKHGKEFGLQNAKQYVEATKKFLTNSPAGTLTKVTSNGDILKYHEATNTFGVKNANGLPRTMFKPKDGLMYWLGVH
jgi:pyocin large subunit-like protein